MPALRYKSSLLLIHLFALFLLSIVAIRSLLLRPSADDYCIAVIADKGIFLGTFHYFMNWSGGITYSFSNLLFVGKPLLKLDLAFASAITFLSAALIVALAVFAILNISIKAVPAFQRLKIFLLVLPPTIIYWWSFWWNPRRLGEKNNLEFGITHWQNLNSAYIIPFAITLILVITIYFSKRSFSLKNIILTTVGLLSGLQGPAFALAVLLTIILFIIHSVIINFKINNYSIYIYFSVGLVSGALIEYFSPGTQLRISQISAFNPLDERSIENIFMWLIPKSILDWSQALLSTSALFVVIAFLLITVLLARIGYIFDAKNIKQITISLFYFAFFYYITSRLSEAFAYEAYWHQVGPRTAIFFFLVALGIYLGARFNTNMNLFFNYSLIFLFIISFLVSASAVLSMTYTMQERIARWEVGPAPTDSTTDIESDWVRWCWDDYTSIRTDLPSRT